MKERLGMTDLRKKANRMNFGELGEDVMQDNIGFDLGQVCYRDRYKKKKKKQFSISP